MRNLFLPVLLLVTMSGWAQIPEKNGQKDTVPEKRLIQYDPSTLRIPGNSLPIGIVTLLGTREIMQTSGFLEGKEGWGRYKLEVEGGSYSNGKIKIGGGNGYKRSDSITVNIYTKKWFLGGKDKWLLTQKIPYNYETSINILTTGNLSKAPGDHVRFGIRTSFDNKMFTDQWFPVKKNTDDFVFTFEGGHISKSKGDLKIDADPGKIINDKVTLIASLAKDTAIRDTLHIVLDYVASYQCKIQSVGRGHDLTVSADVYLDALINARLMKVIVNDSAAHKTYHYLVNTKGGSITISSKGADGSSGRDGWDGSQGLSGSPGAFTTSVQTVNSSDGTPQTTTTEQGAGGPGNPTGSQGPSGADGISGSDGGNGKAGIIIFTSR